MAEVTGMAGVPAGDVLSIDGKLYRLFGIDAVERLQPCYVNGKVWACGSVAIRRLQIFVASEPRRSGACCSTWPSSPGDR